MENKKSIQLSQAFGAVLTLVLVSVLIIVAIVIFVQLSDGFEGVQTTSVINETETIVISTATSANADACGFQSWAPTVVMNGTGFEILEEGVDYTVDSTSGTLDNTTVTESTLLVTYTYAWGSGACEASESMTTEFGNYTSLIGLVGTIIFLGLVIGILVTAFAFGGRRDT